MIVNRTELRAVGAALNQAIASNDTQALARWAAKHGPVAMSQIDFLYDKVPPGAVGSVGSDGAPAQRRDESRPADAAADSPAKNLGERFFGALKKEGGEATFRVAVEKFVSGSHTALVKLLTKWLASEAGLDRKTTGRVGRFLASTKGQAVLAYALSAILTGFGKDPSAGLSKIAKELRVYGHTVAIKAGIDGSLEMLQNYGPMLIQALGSVTSAEDLLSLGRSVEEKVRVAAEAIPAPAAEEEEEEPAARTKASLRKRHG